jgi:hypothetical protein
MSIKASTCLKDRENSAATIYVYIKSSHIYKISLHMMKDEICSADIQQGADVLQGSQKISRGHLRGGNTRRPLAVVAQQLAIKPYKSAR